MPLRQAEHTLAGVTTGTLYTFGHGTLEEGAFVDTVRGAGIERVVDVRSFPGSRHNPQFARDRMEKWLPAADLDYTWLKALGGRRRPEPGSRHVALRNESFRAYADHMDTEEFRAGVKELVDLATDEPAAAMCSESVWWRCHRRLLADHFQLVEGFEVVHLMHDRRLIPHTPTDGVRVDNGELIYDLGGDRPLSG